MLLRSYRAKACLIKEIGPMRFSKMLPNKQNYALAGHVIWHSTDGLQCEDNIFTVKTIKKICVLIMAYLQAFLLDLN